MCVSCCCSVQYVCSTVGVMYVHLVISIRRSDELEYKGDGEVPNQCQTPSTLRVAVSDSNLRYLALHARTTAINS